MKYALFAMVVAAAGLSGCASGPADAKAGSYADPIAVMMDRTEGHRTRWAAAKQAEQELFNDERRILALKRLVWERGYPPEYSNYAIDQLIAIDEAAAKKELSRSIVLIKDWDTLDHLINTAVARNWVDFVPALVRNYSLTTPVYRDHERPERLAIARLRPDKSVEAVVLETFAANADADIKERVAAWALLHRLSGERQKMIALLNDLQTNDPLTSDLRAGAAELSVVPDNLETVTWLQVFRSEPWREYWNRSAAVVAKLSPAQREGLQMRHMPILMWVAEHQPDLLGRDRDALLASLNSQLATGTHYLKGPTYDGPMENHPQVLGEWTDKLVWGDLVTMQVMLGLMRQPQVVKAWFEQADADVADRATEYGGLVRLPAEGMPIAVMYKPLFHKHNWAYLPPKELLTDNYLALAHYHFHAQEHDNRYYSGPGLGDIRNAARQQWNGLVLTFIDKNHLNVDYYQVDEVVVDLGTVRR